MLVKNNPKNFIGQTNQANGGGLTMTIIAYRGCKDIDVRFSNGIEVYHKRYYDFVRGQIACPNCRLHIPTPLEKREQRVNQKVMAQSGHILKIIKYNSSTDVEVLCEDGTIYQHIRYRDFLLGKVGSRHKKERIGLRNKNYEGESMIILAYRSSDDLDIQFEDGTIFAHKTWEEFRTGHIRNPILYKKLKMGNTNTSVEQLKITIIDYRGANDIDIQFEDGVIVQHQKLRDFNAGRIYYPAYPIKLKQIAYTYKNDNNYYCTCSKCGLSDIMSVKEIREHICIDQLKK